MWLPSHAQMISRSCELCAHVAQNRLRLLQARSLSKSCTITNKPLYTIKHFGPNRPASPIKWWLHLPITLPSKAAKTTKKIARVKGRKERTGARIQGFGPTESEPTPRSFSAPTVSALADRKFADLKLYIVDNKVKFVVVEIRLVRVDCVVMQCGWNDLASTQGSREFGGKTCELW